jgi:WD40 repeat protein
VTAIALYRDDTIALSASKDRCILRWDLRNEKRTICHMQRMGGINSFVVAHDYTCLISIGQDKKIVIWDIRMADPIYSRFIDNEDEEGLCISQSHCGRYLVTGGTQGVLRLWEINTQYLKTATAIATISHDVLRLLQIVPAHSKAVTSVSFNLQDKQIVSVGEDGSIFLFFFFPIEEEQH